VLILAPIPGQHQVGAGARRPHQRPLVRSILHRESARLVAAELMCSASRGSLVCRDLHPGPRDPETRLHVSLVSVVSPSEWKHALLHPQPSRLRETLVQGPNPKEYADLFLSARALASSVVEQWGNSQSRSCGGGTGNFGTNRCGTSAVSGLLPWPPSPVPCRACVHKALPFRIKQGTTGTRQLESPQSVDRIAWDVCRECGVRFIYLM
jgi:hypothetical protein